MPLLSFSGVRPAIFSRSGKQAKWLLAGVLTLTFGCANQVMADKGQNMTMPSATVSAFGTLSDATPVEKVTLKNSNNIEVEVISFGGIITRILTPDVNGKLGNIVYGMETIEEYENGNPYLGALIGRYGNRIKDGKFTLNGTEYQLATNDGNNHLHGGVQGFDKKVWKMAPFATANSAGVTLTLVSPDGDQGYPGELTTEVTYTLTNNNNLDMQFIATTDKPTVVNLTQHSYFNLAGKGTILDHELQINGQYITPVDGGLIPTGELAAVAGTPFDFTSPKAIGRDIEAENAQLALGKGYDHNYVLKEDVNSELVEAATVYEPTTGRVLKVLTEEPAVQFYSGNFLDGNTSGFGQQHIFRGALCLEPQHYPDSPNQANFPSTTLLPGEVYSTRIVYAFDTK